MHHHVIQRFPESASAIEALTRIDEGFASLLADYEELNTWLAVRRRSGETKHEEIGNALELIGELETEIRRKLEEQNEHAK